MTPTDRKLKQLVVLSGKGGTGKTSLTAGLVHLAGQSRHHPVFGDADVDAANLALVTEAMPDQSHPFLGSFLAEIDTKRCQNCGVCAEVCRYNAVQSPTEDHPRYRVNDLLCEGCAACVHACPESAIQLHQQQDGEWFQSTTPYGQLFHAELFPAAENSGKLVTTVKQQAKLYAQDNACDLLIVDGPPGIGCPVISASAGADLALLVAEPGVSGIHDLERIIKTLQEFNVPILICINKADLYLPGTEAIKALAGEYGLPLAGEIPFDKAIPNAIIAMQPVTHYMPESPAAQAIVQIWKNVRQTLFGEGVNR
jgi:MinD superfamily P-loop ATPase